MNIEISERTVLKLNLWVKIAVLSSLITGLGLGLLTLVSVVGIWLGFWDFRRGFFLLGIAHQHGQILAWVCLGLSIAIFIAGQFFVIRKSRKFVALAAVGAVVAWAAYLIPESFRPAEGVNYPPIHDISTNRLHPPEFEAILPLRANAANTVEYGGSNNMTAERLIELTDEAYPDLTTKSYSDSTETVFEKALAVVDELGWELVAQDSAVGRIEATDTTFWFRFKDDIVIKIEQADSGSLVDARSVSRVGIGDVGANAIRLRKFFELLDK